MLACLAPELKYNRKHGPTDHSLPPLLPNTVSYTEYVPTVIQREARGPLGAEFRGPAAGALWLPSRLEAMQVAH